MKLDLSEVLQSFSRLFSFLFSPHVLTLRHKHTLPLYTHFPSCSSTEKLLWIIDQERWGNQCGLPRQRADSFPRVSLCLSLCLPLYRCTCFLSAWVSWAKPSHSLALASVCICGAQDASCSLPVAALILHVRLISQTVKICQSECGRTISNLRYKLNV